MDFETKIIPFEMSHFDEVMPRASDFTEEEKISLREKVRQLSSDNQCFSLMIKGQVILFGGIYLHHHKCGEAWLICSDDIRYYQRTSARIVKRQILNMMETLELNRLQTKNENNKFHCRWVEWIGFTREGVLRKFDEFGNDIIMYSIVR